MGAILANQLYKLDPCTDNAWAPTSYRTAQSGPISNQVNNTHNQSSILQSIKISPNPASGIINIKSDNKANFVGDLTIENEVGAIVLKMNNLNTNQQNIDISNLSEGIYTVTLKNASQLLTTKLVVVKH
jgi:hypothetical protein